MKKAERKSHMSLAERAKRRAAVGKAASEKIAKSEQLNFRIEEQKIKELQELAYGKGLPVSSMVYDWVLERLAQEKFGKPEIAGKGLRLLSEIHGILHSFLDSSQSQAKGGIRVAESGSGYDAKKCTRKK